MPIFDKRYYDGPNPKQGTVEQYRADLMTAARSAPDREALVQQEVIAITQAITDGIRELIKQDRRVGDLVRSGVVPLATWTDALLKIASLSRDAMKKKIAEMEHELQHGKVQGFPATLFMAGKPSSRRSSPSTKSRSASNVDCQQRGARTGAGCAPLNSTTAPSSAPLPLRSRRLRRAARRRRSS